LGESADNFIGLNKIFLRRIGNKTGFGIHYIDYRILFEGREKILSISGNFKNTVTGKIDI
jgi:hypothetical protein